MIAEERENIRNKLEDARAEYKRVCYALELQNYAFLLVARMAENDGDSTAVFKDGPFRVPVHGEQGMCITTLPPRITSDQYAKVGQLMKHAQSFGVELEKVGVKLLATQWATGISYAQSLLIDAADVLWARIESLQEQLGSRMTTKNHRASDEKSIFPR